MPLAERQRESMLWSNSSETTGASNANVIKIWSSWIESSSSATCITGGTESAHIWNSWNSATTCNSITLNTAAWEAWNYLAASNIQYVRPRMQTREELARIEAEAKAHREKMAREQRQFQARRRLANVKAKMLLTRFLDEEQRRDLEKYGFFKLYVQRDGVTKVYRIRRGQVQNIDLVEEMPNGLLRPIKTLCAHPTEQVPDADAMLFQKLMLETEEEKFLKIANHMPPVPGALQAPRTLTPQMIAERRVQDLAA